MTPEMITRQFFDGSWGGPAEPALNEPYTDPQGHQRCRVCGSRGRGGWERAEALRAALIEWKEAEQAWRDGAEGEVPGERNFTGLFKMGPIMERLVRAESVLRDLAAPQEKT